MLTQTVGEAIGSAGRKKVAAAMFKRAMHIFAESVKTFTKVLTDTFTPLVRGVTAWMKQVSTIFARDESMLLSWENEGGALIFQRPSHPILSN